MARLPDLETEQSKATVILRAMGNSKRLRILNELADGQERSVSELEEIIATLVSASGTFATGKYCTNTSRIANHLLLD